MTAGAVSIRGPPGCKFRIADYAYRHRSGRDELRNPGDRGGATPSGAQVNRAWHRCAGSCAFQCYHESVFETRKRLMLKTFSFAAALLAVGIMANAQAFHASFDPSTKVFRLDGGNASYVFGVNPRGELQQLYWGGRLAPADAFPQAVPMPEWASFDSSYSNTPQEYPGWGAGLFNEPALKVTF